MGKLDNYVPVNVRVMEARQKNGDNLTLSTETTALTGTTGAVEGFLVKASVTVGGTLVATGHALASDLSEEKSLEKAETVAVGRALAFAGYSADSAIASADEMADFDASSDTEEATSAATTTPAPRSTFGSKRTTGFGRR